VKSECLKFSAIPHTTQLFTDYLYHFDRVRRFYPHPPFSREWLAREAASLRYDFERRTRVAEILDRQNRAWGASPETIESIGRFRAGAAAVVTGQQVALFGGPMFSIYKALTAIKVATEATHAGTDCVPVFWLATEDHDFEEVNHVTLLGPDGALQTLQIATSAPKGAPMSHVRFGADVEMRAQEAAAFLGGGEVTDIVRETYRAGESIGSAFAKLFSRLFAHSGVILIDAADPELHAIAEPVYRAAAVGAAAVDERLFERGKELESAGYHVQVKVTPSTTLLFTTHDGVRVPIHRANGNFSIANDRLSEAELLDRIKAAPQQFSANVLLRPVVEDFVLPTLAYIGGPAEVAYFAQAGVVYEELVGRVTPILPRLSATLVEPRIQRLLEKYRLTLADTFHGDETLRLKMAENTLPGELNASFGSAAASLDKSLQQITAALNRLDPTLVDAAERAASKIKYQLENLRERAARAQSRRMEIQATHASAISNSLFPGKELQEREIGGISFLARYGQQLLLTLYDAAQTVCPDHQVVYLDPKS
jgi:bacillithiol biosynthesis cysteine-adding enzyme BshC